MNPKVPTINPKVSLETFGGLQAKAAREGKSLDSLISEILTAAAKLLLLVALPLALCFPTSRAKLFQTAKNIIALVSPAPEKPCPQKQKHPRTASASRS